MIAKIKSFYKKNKIIIYSVLLPLLFFIFLYIIKSISPFGNKNLLTIDFFHQYGPMLKELYDRVKSGLSLNYSFNMSMGLPFIRNYLNYLSSPFNIIMFFFSEYGILTSYNVIIASKIIAATSIMTYYLSKKNNTKSLYLLIFGLLYGFQSYFIAYYWNIMWLDGLVFLPIIILGIEKIIDEDKHLLYIISLASMIIANYYIAYMICIFSIIYFIGYYIISKKKFNIKNFFKAVGKFVFYSLIAAGITSILIIPLFYGISSISATKDSWPISQYYHFNIKNLLSSFLAGVKYTVLASDNTNTPNIASGILSLLLTITFYFNPKIPLKNKIVYSSIMIILIISFIIGPIDFIWHGFHVPNDLPFRYAFLLPFISITMASISFFNIKNLKIKNILISYIAIAITFIILYFTNGKYLNTNILITSITLLSIYFIFLIKYLNNKKYLLPIIIAIIFVEILYNINPNLDSPTNNNVFYENYNSMQNVLKYVKQKDKSFYRLEQTEIISYNDPSWYNYYGQMGFSSMIYEKLAKLQHNLGLPSNEINSYYYKQTTPLYDLMFNIKYFIGENKDYYAINTELYHSDEYINIYKNNYNLGLMFGINKEIINWNYKDENPFVIQNDFISKGTNIKDLFTKINYQKYILKEDNDESIIKYIVKHPNENIYFYENNKFINYIIVDGVIYKVNNDYDIYNTEFDDEIYQYEQYNEKYIINIPIKNESTIYISYNYYDSNDNDLLLYSMNQQKLDEIYNTLAKKDINIIKFKEDYIIATSSLKEASTIYTSIPYDQGWNVYIDNKKTNTRSLGDCLLSFDVPSGNHQIKLTYNPRGLSIGIIISMFSTIILITYTYIKKRS